MSTSLSHATPARPPAHGLGGIIHAPINCLAPVDEKPCNYTYTLH
ncbi:MAG TPA: hypothetical protein VMF50_06370 [Candidatus Binataceae bacterium]|nr:hypothetical protein [Candidatus Binataceae bacterium]